MFKPNSRLLILIYPIRGISEFHNDSVLLSESGTKAVVKTTDRRIMRSIAGNTLLNEVKSSDIPLHFHVEQIKKKGIE